LGYRYSTPEFILKEMFSYKQFCKLIAAEEINPQGEARSDLRTALQCLTVAQCAGNENSKLADFILEFDKEEAKPQTQEEFDCEMDIWANQIADINRRNGATK
jgi:hypothetical protein